MILDAIENLDRYSFLPYIKDIKYFINSNNIQELPSGDISILGDDLYVKVLRYVPQEASKGFFETHSKYADLQFVVKGIESMFYVNPLKLAATDKFKMDGDFKFYVAEDCISELVVSVGEFTVFLPGEPHKPSCLYGNEANENLKLVFKIRIN